MYNQNDNANEIYDVVKEMCQVAGLSDDFAKNFTENILKDESLLNEFVTYLVKQTFTLENKVKNVSVLDIMVWQVDHFKAHLDRGEFGMKNNECEMILKAFDTFMKMKAEPEKYYRLLTEETGTDFEAKFK